MEETEFLKFLFPFLVIGFVIRDKWFSSLLIFTGYFLGIIDYISGKILGTHIDFFSLLMINKDILIMAPSVIGQWFCVFLGILVPVFAIILIRCKCYENTKVWSSINEWLDAHWIKTRYIIECIIVLTACVAVFSFTSAGRAWRDVVRDGIEYKQLSKCSIDELFAKLGVKGKYLVAKDIEASAGKNVIIIYCESLENGFTDNSLFPGLMPNVNGLIQSGKFIQYKNYKKCLGASYTVGALYATQTGFPCVFFHNNINDIFRRIDNNGVLTVAKVLHKAGYTNYFLSNANLKFGGTGKLMRFLGYDVLEFKDFHIKGEKTIWGMHDKVLFDQAKMEYLKLKKTKKPFNLTLLTVDTHFPEGIPDLSMRGFVAEKYKPNSLEYSINALDYLIGDFCRFIANETDSDNTEIIIIGDHPVMGNDDITPMLRLLSKTERNIALISSKKSRLYEESSLLGFYNVPSFILDIADVKHNAVFSNDLIPNMSSEKIRQNKAIFTNLNLKFTTNTD